ncbi:MAG TPA: M81 family metallopeptidase [Bacillota bacterium]|nr:M81 family metallopeptidase [Bacillota bacterium]
MALRIAVGGLSHETNTFCNPTPLTAFHCLRGGEILAAHRGVRDYVGGMLAAAEDLGIAVVPTFEADAEPSGIIDGAAFQAMLRELTDALRAAGHVDAVCLSLHGAGVADGCDHIEEATLAAVRTAVGPGVPIAATLDLHGNLTPAIAKHADLLFGNQLYPHSDSFERGQEAVAALLRLVRGEIRPVTVVRPVPVLIATSTSDFDPVKSLNEACQALERRAGILDVTFFHGFGNTDIPEMGASILAIADGDPALAAAAAQEAAAAVWARRAEFDPPHPDAPEAVQAALRAVREVGGPVVLNDSSDNPGGGGPGDGTHLLRALLAAGAERTALGYIYDPATADQAHVAGVGARIQVRLGGKTYPIHGEPVEATAYVKSLTDGRFVLSTPMGRGMLQDLGRMARLEIGGVDVLVASVRTQVLDAEAFLLHGIDVRRCNLVVVKSENHFRAGFRDLATQILTADTPGLTSSNLRAFPYARVRRPVWPLDANTEVKADA